MAASVDIVYIAKRLKDFKRGLIDFENLLEGIYIDMDIRHGRKYYKLKIQDHLEALKSELEDGYIKDSELPELAKEIYYMEFLPKENKMKKLTTEQKSKVKKFIKNLKESNLSPETLDRMEGLTNQKFLSALRQSITSLADDLFTEGFETDEVKDYLNYIFNKLLIKIR